MIAFILLLILSGISLLILTGKEIKASYFLAYGLLLGLGIHTALFTLFGFLNIYYSNLIFTGITFILLVAALINYKYKNIRIVNDIKKIPFIYIAVLAFVAFRLYVLITSGFSNYYHWDELRVYQFISKEIFVTHNMNYMYSFSSSMSFFIGNATYSLAGVDLLNPRIFNIVIFLNISVLIYFQLIDVGVNRKTSSLLAVLYLVSSAENLLFYRSFYNNLHYAAFFTSGIYLFNKGLFKEEKTDFKLGYLLLLFSILIRREGIFLLVGYLILLYGYLIIKKCKKFFNLVKLLCIPVIYHIAFTVLQKMCIVGSKYKELTLPADHSDIVHHKRIIGNISSIDDIVDYIKNAFDQMFNMGRFTSNYIIFVISVFVILILIYKIIRKKTVSNSKIIISILLAELIYFGIVFGTHVFLMTKDEFITAASLSRYLLSVVPINFVLLGSLILVDNKKEKISQSIKNDNPKVLIIVPCYNEKNNIVSVYDHFKDYKKKSKYDVDMIVVNDGSTDDTLEIIKKHKIPHLNLVQNLGIGGAVQTGYRYAYDNDYDIAIQLDGDGQHDISYIEKLIKPISDGEADMTIASRFVNKKLDGFKSTAARRIGIKIISATIKIVTGKKIYDPTSGFRASNKKIIEKFANNYPQEYPEAITDSILLKDGYVVKEVPTVMKDRKGGKSSIGSWKNVYFMINVVLLIIINGMGDSDEF